MTNNILRRPVWAAYFVLLGILLTFIACEKPEDNLGLDLIAEEDLLGLRTVVDSVALSPYTVLADSGRTNELSRAMLGDFRHPEMGRTQASIYTQIRLSALGAEFDGEDGNDAVVDSLVLSFQYFATDSVYGELEPMQFSVMRLDEDLDLDSAYYSDDETEVINEELLFDPSPITPAQNDSTFLYGESFPPQLRLRLKDELGGALIIEARDGLAFEGVSEFVEYFKGFRITAENLGSTGSILTLDLLQARSLLTLYYHNNDEDSLSFDLSINENAQRYVNLSHDYTGFVAGNALLDASQRDQQLYLQAAAGLNVAVDLPLLQSIADTSDTAFNKVELVFPVTFPENQAINDFPERLFAIYVDSDGDVISIPDIFEGELHSDGFYDEDAGEYRLNITRFSQQVVNGEVDTSSLRILPVNNTISPNLVQLIGVDSLTAGAKMIVTYTQYE